MKNLIDELNNLGEFEYSVSPDFSKKVMKNIRSQRLLSRVILFSSLASAACVFCLCIIIVNSSMSSKSVSMMADSGVSLLTQYEGTAKADVEEKTISAENSPAVFNDEADKVEAVARTEIETEGFLEDSITNSVFYKSYSLQEYIEDILKVLEDNGFIASQKEDIIVVESVDITNIEELLKNYENIDISIVNEQVLIIVQ